MRKLGLKRGIAIAVLSVIVSFCAVFALVSLSGSNVNIAYADEHAGHYTWTDLNNDASTLTALGENCGTLTGGNNKANPKYYYLSDDLTLENNNITISSGYVTLCLNGHMLTGNGSGSVITVNSGATLDLCDCNSTGSTHCFVSGENGYTLCTTCEDGDDCSCGGDTCIQVTGGVITGGTGNTNSSNTYGGGIYVEGTLHMHGGTIAGNTASYGGGVSTKDGDGAVIEMDGGSIGYNTATTSGGGVFVAGASAESRSKFTMSDGTIANNVASAGNGGGIFCNGGEVTVSGGNIKYNKAEKDYNQYGNGGGIAGANKSSGGGSSIPCVITIKGGTISENTAAQFGGGVALTQGTLEITGGTISNNTAVLFGGGVCVREEGATLTMLGGTISDNQVTGTGSESGYGGGISVRNGATATITGGTVSGNSAQYGGGIVVYSTSSSKSSLTIGDCENTGCKPVIANNTATSCGGGIYVNEYSTLTMYSGTIGAANANAANANNDNANTAVNGGGVYINGSSAKFDMCGGTIAGNTADAKEEEVKSSNNSGEGLGGGVAVLNGAEFTMSGGTISYNKAYSSSAAETEKFGEGGGVYVGGSNSGSTFTMTGGAISHNHAGHNGGGVYVHQESTFTMGAEVANVASRNSTSATDLEITANEAQYFGGGVYVNRDSSSSDYSKGGKFIMYSGSIKNNTALTGGGIYVHSGNGSAASVQLLATGSGNSIEISGNRAATNEDITEDLAGLGGGVYAGATTADGTTYAADLDIAGNVTITGNTAGESTDNLHLANGVVINANELCDNDDTSYSITPSGDGAAIGITLAEDYVNAENPGVFANSAGKCNPFSSDSGIWEVGSEEGKYYLYAEIEVSVSDGSLNCTWSVEGEGVSVGDGEKSKNIYLRYGGEFCFTVVTEKGYHYTINLFDSNEDVLVVSGEEACSADSYKNNYDITTESYIEARKKECSNNYIYISWELNSYIVKFENVGSATYTKNGINCSEGSCTAGPYKCISLSAATLRGYVFKGWTYSVKNSNGCPIIGDTCICADGSNYVISAEDVLKNLTHGDVITITAKWELDVPKVDSVKLCDGGNSASWSDNAYTKIYDGQTVTLSVTTSGSAPTGYEYTYQWYKCGDKITGETTESIKLVNVEDAGEYHCIVGIKKTCEAEPEVTVQNDPGAVTECTGKYTVTITAAELTVKWKVNDNCVEDTSYEDTYDGNEWSVTVTVTGVNDETFTAQITIRKTDCEETCVIKNAGCYTATITSISGCGGASADNYKSVIDKSISVKVNKATLYIKSIVATDRAYDGTTKVDLTITLCGSTNYDCIAATASGTVDSADAGEGKSVTVGKITLNGDAASNYELAEEEYSDTVTVDISKVQLTISGTSVSGREYNGSTDISVNVTIGTVTGIIEKDKENVKVTISSATLSSADAGTRCVTVVYEVSCGTNYIAPKCQTIEVTISPKKITVNWSNTDLTYNGSAQKPEATSDDFVYGDEVSISVTTNDGDAINAGNYTATATLTGDKAGNYEIVCGATHEFTIAKAELSIAWTGNSFEYDGTAKYPTAKVSGVKGSDSLGISVTIEATEGSNLTDGVAINVGSYKITISISNNNYMIASCESHEFEITAKEIQITWSGGSFTYNGQVQAPTASFEGVVNGDDLGVSYTGDTDAVNVGSYTITATVGNANYIVTKDKLQQAFSIVPLDISNANVELGDSLTYNGSEQEQTITSVTVNGLIVTYEVSDNTGTNADTYELTITGNGNFTGTASKSWSIAALDISEAEITLGNSLTYNGSEQIQTIASVTVDGLDVTYNVSGNTGTNAGEYTLTITGNGNFTGTRKVTFTIAKAVMYTLPEGLTAKSGDTLADVELPEGWSWVDDSTKVGWSGERSFEATYTPDDTDNYEIVTVEVTVSVAPNFDWVPKVLAILLGLVLLCELGYIAKLVYRRRSR